MHAQGRPGLRFTSSPTLEWADPSETGATFSFSVLASDVSGES